MLPLDLSQTVARKALTAHYFYDTYEHYNTLSFHGS
jgi:hypothetical protein